jgi:phenylacetate-CoA ligase
MLRSRHHPDKETAGARTGLRSRLTSAITGLVVEPTMRTPYLSTARWLTDFFSWPEHLRRRWQAKRMQQVVQHARAHVPYYRELLGGHLGTVGLDDLPVVSKATFRKRMDDFLTENWRDVPHVRKQTGGTTGDPFQYPLDKRAWTQIYAANLYFWGLLGYRYGERLVMLGTPPSMHPRHHSWKDALRDALENRVISATGLDIEPETSLERALVAGRARGSLWYGYASITAAMADAVLEAGVRVPGPKAIVTTAEMLFPEWRERIERAFGAPVHDQYGCNDGGIMSQSCTQGRLHIAENVSIVEIIDDNGRRCPPGDEGDVVVTNLHARALPFLRYRTGDRAVLGEGTCPCGTEGMFLERVVGRRGDALRLPDGRHVSCHAVGVCFSNARHVRRWQCVQSDPERIQLRLDADPEFTADEGAAIVEAVRHKVGDTVAVDLTTDKPLERTRGGKHRIVVRTFD